MAGSRVGLLAGALALAGAGALWAGAAVAAPDGSVALDVAIAIDTTGSMTPSIEQARQDAKKVVADTRSALPNARFAIVQFRDDGDRPEYQLVQPLTASPDEVDAAVSGLFADGGADSPEAYNLVFERVASDPAIGFRAGARRLLIVIGDAEPHGAGTSGLAGCADTSADPRGLETRAALAKLKAAEITLSMILQQSSASTTLECYRSLAAGGFGQGSATTSGPAPGPGGPGGPGGPRGTPGTAGAPALAPILRRTIRSAFPTVAIAAPRPARRRAPVAWTLRLVNPTPAAVTLSRVQLTLPVGVRYVAGSARGLTRTDPVRSGRVLTWTLGSRLPAGARTLRVAVRLPATGAVARPMALARLVLATGGPFVTRA